MEEKKLKAEELEKGHPNKLTYEQLEAAANQISEQARALYNENQNLRKTINKLTLNDVFAQLELRFKVLNYSSFFPSEFIDRIMNEIVDTMTPRNQEENTDNLNEEGK